MLLQEGGHLQAKDRGLKKIQPTNILILEFLPLKIGRKKKILFFSIPSVVICYGSHNNGKLMQLERVY